MWKLEKGDIVKCIIPDTGELTLDLSLIHIYNMKKNSWQKQIVTVIYKI